MSSIGEVDDDLEFSGDSGEVERLEAILPHCDAFEDAWLGKLNPRIEDFLGRVAPELRDELLRELLSIEILIRSERGEHPQPSEYEARFPRDFGLIVGVFHASATPGPNRIQGRFPASRDSDEEGGSLTAILLPGTGLPMFPPGSARREFQADGDGLAFGARFKHLESRDDGGMGRVSKVYDRAHRRIVAIKEIKPRYVGNPVYRERFLREARITGALNHPGIVPIHALGRYSDRSPYYVMRWIDGTDLRKVIRAYHEARAAARTEAEAPSTLESRRLLAQFAEVCRIVQSAHDQGVLHRDLKPQNVMVGRNGEVIVLDWGLARFLDPAREAADPAPAPVPPEAGGTHLSARSLDVVAELTNHGEFQGTHGYASPEHYADSPVALTARSDVYSLGASLFVLLTGENPFRVDAASRGSDFKGRVLRGDFPSPCELLPTIHPDLQAICLKAMATDPAARYPSALALAQDVERWLADEPVSARRSPIHAKVFRWARRHSNVVAGAVTLLATATVGLTIGSIYIGGARRNADLARQRAQVNFAQALTTNDELLKSVTMGPLASLPGSEPMRLEVARKLIASYEGLLAAPENGDPVRAKLAFAYRVQANIHRQLGEFDRAQPLYDRAIQLHKDLVESGGDPMAHQGRAAEVAIDATYNLMYDKGMDEAVAYWERARRDLRLSIDEPMLSHAVRARAATVEAASQQYQGKTRRAIELQSEAIRATEKRIAADLVSPAELLQLHLAYTNLGTWLCEVADFENAREAFAGAERLTQAGPLKGQFAENVLIADSMLKHRRGLYLPGPPAERLADLEAAVAGFKSASEHFPASSGYRLQGIDSEISLAGLLREGAPADRQRAVSVCQAAVEASRKLTQASRHPGHIKRLAEALIELGLAHGSIPGREAERERAHAEAQEILAEHADSPHLRRTYQRFIDAQTRQRVN